MRRTLAAVAVLGLLTAACSGEDATLAAPSPTGSIVGADPDCPTDGQEYPADERPASEASVTIVRPKRGQVIRDDVVDIKVRVRGACILAESQRAIRPDTGHVHIGLDGRTLEFFAGLEYELTDIEPGNHILEVEFSAADHLPFNPPVVETVTFKVVES